jgi:hypothetical protein
MKINARKLKPLQCLMSKGPVVQSCNVDGRAGGGCKAAAREKVRLGYDRKGPKLLFVQSNLSKSI